MPIGFDPNESALVTLDCIDGGKPERCRFRCRYLSERELGQVRRWLSEANDAATDDAAAALLDKAILAGMTGWENVRSNGEPVPFSPEALGEFTLLQKFSIVVEYPTRLWLSERDRKNSSSPAISTTAPSAGEAQANPADAKP